MPRLSSPAPIAGARGWFALLLLTTCCLAATPLRPAANSVTGTYENTGSVVETESDYKGSVSLRALLGLDFDLARGLRLAADVPRLEFEQRDRTFVIRAKDARGETEWTAKWERNGGFEPTQEGLKFLIRGRSTTDLYLFTLSAINEGAALLVEVQQVKDSPSGPIGIPLGKYLFLRSPEPEATRRDK